MLDFNDFFYLKMDKNRTKNHQDTLAIIQNQCVMILSYAE
ncbi:hypothetical protein BAZMOX_432973_0 [methanotrophic endosymbiont of Bathymodiolus azoricus (Menez Gwen)]|nr:hypothetical protein BAZMOX_432973_0 [methanotrophic endosymbiont of Bathymodiolus azoricus (Menez Gwen)]